MGQSETLKPHAAPFKLGGPYAWFVVFILCLVSITGYVDRQVINLLVEPIKADLGINDTQIGLLQGFSFVFLYAIAAIPIAWLADYGKRTTVITVGILCWSLATFSCGLATSFLLMFAARTLVGLGEVTLAPSGYSILGDYFPKERVGLAISLFTGSGFLGSGLAYIIGGMIVGHLSQVDTYSIPIFGAVKPWQLVFMVVALPGLFLVLVMQLVKEPPRKSVVDAEAVRMKAIQSFAALFKYIKANQRLFGGLFIGFSLMAAATYAIVNWTPAYLMRSFGWTAAQAGIKFGPVLMLASTAGVFAGGFIASAWMKRGGHGANLLVSIGAALIAVGFAYAFANADSGERALFLLAPTLFFGAMPFGCGTATLPLVTPNRLRAQVVALYLLVANLLGLTLGPTGVGAIADFVFKDESRIGDALGILAPALYLFGALIAILAVAPYAKIIQNSDAAQQAPPTE